MKIKADGVAAGTLARLWNITIEEFHQLTAAPGFPAQVDRGRWPASKATHWYIIHLQAALRHNSLVGTLDETLREMDPDAPGRTLQ